MRNTCPIVLAVVLSVPAFPAAAANLDWSVPATVAPGDTFTAVAVLSNVGDLVPVLPAGGIEAARVDLAWDPTALAYGDARIGAGFAGSAFALLDVFPDPPGPGAFFGLIEAVAAPAPGEGFELVEIDLVVPASAVPGTLTVSFDVSLQEDAVVFTGSFPVRVAPAATPFPVPLPALPLGALGLALLALGVRLAAAGTGHRASVRP